MARQKNLARRHEILRNTFMLLKKRGMENVSLQMIADKSGISKSLLQSYYPRKNLLINEIVTTFMSTFLSIDESKISQTLVEAKSALQKYELTTLTQAINKMFDN